MFNTILYCICSDSGYCSHIIALVQTLMHYQQLGLKEVPTEISATSLPQKWHIPRGRTMVSEPVCQMVMAKPGQGRRKRVPVYRRPYRQR